ncbi:CBO0543 family protein [Texcoconibacillus texcoconensis]|nr:CBO0543 family protein [Texcoconibacillus texcoconensis]
MSEKKFLWALFGLGIIAFPWVIFRKAPLKDWVIVYFIVGFVSGIIDNIVTAKGFLRYPVKAFPRFFNVSCTFDFVVCPLMNVIYNQVTYHDKPHKTVLKLFLFITPMTLFETFLEKNTNLIQWRMGWKWYHTYVSIFIKYLSVRFIMTLIRYSSYLQNVYVDKKSINFDVEQ